MRLFASGWWRSRSTDWRLEQEIAEELRFHLACRADDNVAAGMSERDAQRDAAQRLGDFGVVVADGMRMRRGPRRSPRKRTPLDGLLYDLRYGLRLLRASPVTSLVAVLSLALGVGVSTAIFSVMRSTILAPLPFPEADRLVTLYESNEYWAERVLLARAEYLDWRDQKQIFADVAGTWDIVADLEEGDESERLWLQHVTPNLFSMLGLEIVLGRGFTDDDTPETPLAVVLSYGLWQRRFAGDPAVIGRAIRLRSRQYTVIGVLQTDAAIPHLGTQAFGFPPVNGGVDAWIDVMQTRQPTDRSYHSIFAIGRLAPGVTLERAQREAAILVRRFEEAHPHTTGARPGTPEQVSAAQGVVLEGLRHDMSAPYQLPVLLPFGAAALIILIGCANVANLLLTRATGREREIAVRAALGASRARLFRQLLSESVVLGCLGGIGALVAAMWLLDILPLLAPNDLFSGLARRHHASRLGLFSIQEVDLSVSVLVYGVVLSFGTVLLFGVVPALWGAGVNISGSLVSSGRVWRRRAAGNWLRHGFLVAQIGFSLTLLVGAGLLVGTVQNIMALDVGIDHQGLVQAELEFPRRLDARYFRDSEVTILGETYPVRGGAPSQTPVLHRVREELEATPGVESAVLLDFKLQVFTMADQPQPNAIVAMPRTSSAMPLAGDYLHTVGARMVDGVAVLESDPARDAKVVVNQAFVRAFSPDEPAVGRAIRQYDGVELEIVGVFADTHHFDELLSDVQPIMLYYAPYADFRRVSMLVRTTLADPSGLRGMFDRAVKAADPALSTVSFAILEDSLYESVAPQQFFMRVLTFFAAAALVLSLIGVYGSFSFFVVQQRRELGIRLALGARRSAIARMVLGRASVVTGIGIVLGLGVALASTRVLSSFLYQLEPTDPVTFVGVSVLLFAVALLASYVPARRAARVDPVKVLRAE